MRNSTIRFSSVSLFVLLACCAPAKILGQVILVDSCVAKFKPVFKSDLYNTSVDVIGRHISGLLLFKEMPDGSMRLVFTNEAGVKFFDFEFSANGTFKVMQVISQLDRKPVIKTFRKDFELLMMTRLISSNVMPMDDVDGVRIGFRRKKESDYVITDGGCTTLLRLEKEIKGKKKTEIRFFGKQQTSPDSIFISHKDFSMDLKLKKLDRTLKTGD